MCSFGSWKSKQAEQMRKVEVPPQSCLFFFPPQNALYFSDVSLLIAGSSQFCHLKISFAPGLAVGLAVPCGFLIPGGLALPSCLPCDTLQSGLGCLLCSQLSPAAFHVSWIRPQKHFWLAHGAEQWPSGLCRRNAQSTALLLWMQSH